MCSTGQSPTLFEQKAVLLGPGTSVGIRVGQSILCYASFPGRCMKHSAKALLLLLALMGTIGTILFRRQDRKLVIAKSLEVSGISGVSHHELWRLVSDPMRQEKPEGWTRFVCFSDTHGLHNEIPRSHRPKADVLLHGGDFTNTGEPDQVKSFTSWLQDYPAKHKVVIAGNHDLTIQPDFYQRAWRRFHRRPFNSTKARAVLLDDARDWVYLEDGSTEVMGYRIYGSPWQPTFGDWAFNVERGAASRAVWSRIPQDVDILITHGPPYGIGDLCISGKRAGCKDLLEAIRNLAVPPAVSVFGHIHEGYGIANDSNTLFLNPSTCTIDYAPTNPPIVVDLPPAEELWKRRAERVAERTAQQLHR
eukprot:gnl/TRDRNA2_/TRDRNA2_90274_c0_seq2.p1 gnl/TRDRNA2_/TRDRNA2_90274_c0~~gnl/TRDRNA2_/TRDRNA2_90274_c0_seq2.p1  ORF type:complete len:362 (-),score=28.62 gnl/TRDRNA2_/TRDRNA2_90274_c0_seq2:503-1588(-)